MCICVCNGFVEVRGGSWRITWHALRARYHTLRKLLSKQENSLKCVCVCNGFVEDHLTRASRALSHTSKTFVKTIEFFEMCVYVSVTGS